ncbi:MAG: hypothetical protein AB1716_10710 [Planctomycetota bacterium]
MRGLHADGFCPECHAPIAVALAGDLLDVADPAWLGRLVHGARVAQITFGVGLPAELLLSVLARDFSWGPAALAAGTLTALIGGVWLMGAPNPRVSRAEAKLAPRRLLRAMAVIAGLSLPLSLAVYAVPFSRGWAWVQLIAGPFGGVGVVGAFAATRYLGELAHRVGDGFTFRRAGLYWRVFLVSWLLAAVGAVLLLLRVMPGICLITPGGAGMLGSGFLILMLPGNLAGGLAQKRATAEAAWAAARALGQQG